MKRLVWLLLAASCFAQTPNLGLTILPRKSPNWDVATNANWNLVDAGTIIKAPKAAQAITGGFTFTVNSNFQVDPTGNLAINPSAGLIFLNAATGEGNFGAVSIGGTGGCNSATSICWSSGTGSPQGVVTGHVGSIYSNTNAIGSLYFKNNGVSNTGWVQFITSGPVINGVSYSANYPGATLDVRANACLSDAELLANGNTTGICDATGETGNQTIAAQINVGDASEDEVAFRVPVSAVWTATMADGTSCAIKQFGNASIIGSPASGLNKTFKIQPHNSSNLGYIYCTDTASNSNYMYASGFTIYNQSVATANSVGMYIAGFIYDSSHWENIYILDAKDNYAMKVYGACCSATFSNMQIDSEFVAGGTPLWIAQDGSTSTKTQGLNFVDMTVVKPGPTKPLIKITDTTHTMALNFTNIYSETSSTDTTTALYTISGPLSVNFNGINFHSNVASSTATAITVDNSYNTMLTVQGLTMGPGAGTFTYPATAVADSNLNSTVLTNAVGNLAIYPVDRTSIYLTSAYTNATTTPSNLTDGTHNMAFTVAPSTNYKIYCDLIYQSSNTTAGLEMKVTGPASPTAVNIDYFSWLTPTSSHDDAQTAFAGTLGSSLTYTATTNFSGRLFINLVNGANAGTVQVQAMASGSGTVTVQPGGVCQMTRQ